MATGHTVVCLSVGVSHNTHRHKKASPDICAVQEENSRRMRVLGGLNSGLAVRDAAIAQDAWRKKI